MRICGLHPLSKWACLKILPTSTIFILASFNCLSRKYINNEGVGSVRNFRENSCKMIDWSSSDLFFSFYFGPFTSIMNECKSVKVLIWLNDHVLKVINMQSIRIKERNLKFIRQQLLNNLLVNNILNSQRLHLNHTPFRNSFQLSSSRALSKRKNED